MGQAAAVAWQDLQEFIFSAGPNAALLTLPDVTLWQAGYDAEIVWASEIHEVIGTDGSAVTADLVKVADGTIAANGTSLLATTFNLKGTAATRQVRSLSAGTLASDRIIYSGQRLAINFGGTMTAVAGLNITVWINRIRRPSW